MPPLTPVVEFKRPKSADEIEFTRDKYGQVVTEQMRERKAMSELGYETDREVDNQYQAYHGAPVHDTIMDLFISALMAVAFLMCLTVCGYWTWTLVFREKRLTSYTGGDKEMIYLRD